MTVVCSVLAFLRGKDREAEGTEGKKEQGRGTPGQQHTTMKY